MKQKLKNYLAKEGWYHFLLLLVVFCSILAYAPRFAPHFSSDNAIHVIMTRHFDSLNDFYYWGQDRLGSILPLFSSIFYWSGLKAIDATGLILYACLISTFFYLASFFKSTLNKLLFAVFLFLPISTFVEMNSIGHPYSAQMLLFCGSLWVFRKIKTNAGYQYAVVAVLFLCLSLWVSEMSLLFIGLVFISGLNWSLGLKLNPEVSNRFTQGKYTLHYHLQSRRIQLLLFITFALIVGAFCLRYIKNANPWPPQSESIMVDSLEKVGALIHTSALMYKTDLGLGADQKTLVGITKWLYSWLFLLFPLFLIVGIALQRKTNKKIEPGIQILFAFGLVFFLFSFFLRAAYHTTIELYYSHVRYYSISYLFALLFALVLVDQSSNLNFKRIGKAYLILLALCSIGNNWTKISEPSVYQRLKPLERKAQHAGLVGSYWESYVFGCLDEEKLMASARFQNRNNDHYLKTLQRNNLYLVADKWFEASQSQVVKDNFYAFELKGEPFKIGPYTLRKASLNDTSVLSDPSLFFWNEQTNRIDKASQKKGYWMYGPYWNCLPGSYEAQVDVYVDTLIGPSSYTFDVYSKTLNYQVPKSITLDEEGFYQFSIKFKLPEDVNDLEVRILKEDNNSKASFRQARFIIHQLGLNKQ